MNKIRGLSALVVLCAVSVSASTPRTFIHPRSNENKTDPPFSGAVKVGDTYRTYFTKEFPARAFLGSGTLLFGARFEVMGIAVKR